MRVDACYFIPETKLVKKGDAGDFIRELVEVMELCRALRETGEGEVAQDVEDDVHMLLHAVADFLDEGAEVEFRDYTATKFETMARTFPEASKVEFGCTPLSHAEVAMRMLAHAGKRVLEGTREEAA